MFKPGRVRSHQPKGIRSKGKSVKLSLVRPTMFKALGKRVKVKGSKV